MTDSTFFALEFTSSLSARDDEPSRFVYEYEGRIASFDEEGNDVPMGRCMARYIDVDGALDEGESVFDVFDSYESTLGYFEALYDENGLLRSEVTRLCDADGVWACNVVVLERLEIFPEHRGLGIGLGVLHCLIRRLKPGAGLFVMKPFPLQFEAGPEDADPERARLNLQAFSRDHRRATAALKRYYGKLGFKTIPRTPYMLRDASLALPSIASLLSEPDL